MKNFMIFKKEKSSLHFTGKRVSGAGVGATVMGAIGWIVFVGLSVYSAGSGGQAEFFVGVIGLLDAILCLVGAIVAYRALQERDIYYAVPIVGLVLNAILFVLYFSLYFMGIAVQ